jgi:C1A family cysteine protease
VQPDLRQRTKWEPAKPLLAAAALALPPVGVEMGRQAWYNRVMGKSDYATVSLRRKGIIMHSNRALWILAAVGILTLAGMGPLIGSAKGAESGLEDVRKAIEAEGLSWIAEETDISRLPAEERQQLLGLIVPEGYEARLEAIRAKGPAYAPLALPSRFDWTDSAGVSPVRYQRCGDCWCQCAVAAIESKMRIFDDDNTRLSVQQGIDCNFGGSSCSGGWMSDVYDLYRVVGAVSQTCYPYRNGVDGTCDQDACDFLLNIDGHEEIDTSVASIKTHLMTNGPIAVGMTVFNDFYYYGGGCYEHAGNGAINHGVLIVGWDDSMCGGEGAWHVKNSWGTGWGESGYCWMKYGTADVGYGAEIVHYAPRNRSRLLVDSFLIDDSAGDGDGMPEAGESIFLPLTLENTGWEGATGVTATISSPDPEVTITTASAVFPDIASGSSGQSASPHFAFFINGAVPCGRRLHFIISVDSDQGVSTDTFEMLVSDAQTVFFDDVESDLGWSLEAPDDDATVGDWRWLNPRGSLQDSFLVQAELDHTPGGATQAFVTQNAKRSFVPDFNDVDGGKTTLTSPVIDLSDYASALLRYWRWYTNDTGEYTDDIWQVDVSGDGGTSWVSLEAETASERSWQPREYDLGQYVLLSDQVIVRFVASDYADESTVEAVVDDIEITGCPASVDVTPATVEVVSPNGGEAIGEGSEYEIQWNASDDYGVRHFTVLASYDGGSTFGDTVCVLGGMETAFSWSVPMGEHSDCIIKVEATDRGYNNGSDVSDAPFAIVQDISGLEEKTPELPAEVKLIGGERNPFTGSTHIFFALPRRMGVSIRIFDAQGRVTRELVDMSAGAGYHSVLWDGRSDSGSVAAPGVYFVRLDAGTVGLTCKLVLAR